ncbi:MAG TPA: NAD(P)H-binding protein [Thermoanaerobaculia bacterium]|nr:NAD(P)H-binding protein [Thermoanaerobaculia bacterium]
MKIAITGGTGFVGRHLAQRFDDVVLISRRTGIAVDDVDTLAKAFEGCDAVAHCAGINREIGAQTYQRVHIDGTRAVIEAAKRAGVRKIVMLSFLRARPSCGSRYHESKWAAEELVRGSGLDYTILKSGMIYGRGDHMLDHLSHALHTFPLFLMVGLREKAIRPVAIDDLVDVLHAAILGRLSRETVVVTGAEELTLSDAVRRVARVVGRNVWMLRAPVWMHYVLAQMFEWTMTVPLVAKAQVRILSEGVSGASTVPSDLTPQRMFTDEQIARGLPERGGFGLRDLRCCGQRP